MAENLLVNRSLSKAEQYENLLPQIKALISGEPNMVANMANIAAALKQAFNFFWVGFYTLDENNLVLAPFQGPIACTRIAFGKGVCGKVWESQETIVVDDVNAFPGHIACSSESLSEIVIPIFSKGNFIGVLDVDSNKLADFDSTDKKYLEELVTLLD